MCVWDAGNVSISDVECQGSGPWLSAKVPLLGASSAVRILLTSAGVRVSHNKWSRRANEGQVFLVP